MSKNERGDIPDDAGMGEEELLQKAKETKQEKEAAHSAMLEAVAEGEKSISVENYESVEIGEVEVKVKAWVPGEAMDTISQSQRLLQRDNLHDATESFHTFVEAMTTVTEALEYGDVELTDNPDIRQFWKGMYDEWGFQGFVEAANTVLEPSMSEREAKEDAIKSFPED